MAENQGNEGIRAGNAPVPPMRGTEISLGRNPAPPAATAEKAPPRPAKETKGSDFREFIDTIVFVVVLVLMLKTFLAEAFVIPTGSMATTLLGYHKDVTCEKCGYRFRVNCSSEVEPQDGVLRPVVGCWCPNCAYYNRLSSDVAGGGLP